ncbi:MULTISPECIES: gp16 family protein [unclassified Pseudoalteromonas]|uniref:gp16 family protein n=1 Tax=unclassified Pseudoalteromonas TaxID=194690 RepID=UPI001F279E49|nr:MULTISPECIES: regulatory protein GemA [unclassified Pseudoalteromonas]MCF2829804.1 regulatory protein GemA [Pseudoalteromonas sp. OF5H-5]MCF2834496.1 regulatory protein GemA [Pseudoalteromonas sp. DL2-H6]MCF2927770.1 regulatory protein GemA [Pseudoalteromonas sp. DL2-H1]
MYLSKSKLIQLIHVGKTSLGWDEDLYRQNLVKLTKKESCKGMNLGELKRVLDHMKDKGFKVEAKKSGKGRNSPMTRDIAPEDKTPLDKLRQVWIAMSHRGYLRDGSEAALLNWSKSQAKRMNSNVAIECLEWLRAPMVHALIEQLKSWYARLMAKDMSELAPDLKKLPLNDEEKFEAGRFVYKYSNFSNCNVEQLESALNFTGQMLGKYSEVPSV